MPAYPRDELEEMWRRWLAANRQAEADGNWEPMANLFAEDASYGWMYTPDRHFMAIGRQEIRDLALGQEMLGFEGWQYPYVSQVIDDQQGMIVGFWRQIADVNDPDTSEPYEIIGIGGSWFGYGGDFQWAWQRDFFDVASAGATMGKMFKDGNVGESLQKRMTTDPASVKGHYARADLPAPMWPPSVDA